MKPVRLVAAGIVTLALAGAGYVGYVRGGMQSAPAVGYTLLDGRPSSLQQLRGKVVLVNFWATDCAPCLREMPQFATLHEKFKARGYDMLAVAMRHDPPALVINYAAQHRLPFDVVIDNTGAVAQGFGAVQVTPTTVLIDRRGQIVERYVGEVDFAALQRRVEDLLGPA